MRMGCRASVVALFLLSACINEAPDRFPQARPEARPGGRIVVGINKPASIEPSNAFEPAGSLVVRTMCDTLISFDPATGAAKPAIAESWQFVDNGKQLLIKLRKGIKFHDGSDLTSEDVAYSLSRVADDDYASAVAGLLKPILGFDEMHGDIETENEELLESLAGVRPTESNGLAIVLKSPLADFFKVLGHPLAAPISKKAAEADPEAFAQKPVCAGPYRMAEPWDPTKPAIKLTRFSGYYGRNLAFTRGGRGYADNIEFRIEPDVNGSFGAYEAGNSDIAAVPPDRIAEVRGLPGFFQVPATMLEYIGLPTTVEPFNNPGVRLALSLALDRNRIVESVFGAGRSPATGMLPPGAGDVHRRNACQQVPAAGDRAGAQRVLGLTGVNLAGTKLKLYFNDEFRNRQLVEAVGAQWAEAFGVAIEITPMSWDEYLAKATGQAGFDGPFRMSWEAGYPSPDRYLYPLFHSDSIGENNFTRFSSADFDRLLERGARRVQSEEEIRVEYRRLEDLACDRLPVIPITFGTREYLYRAERVTPAAEALGDVVFGEPSVREFYVSAQ